MTHRRAAKPCPSGTRLDEFYTRAPGRVRARFECGRCGRAWAAASFEAINDAAERAAPSPPPPRPARRRREPDAGDFFLAVRRVARAAHARGVVLGYRTAFERLYPVFTELSDELAWRASQAAWRPTHAKIHGAAAAATWWGAELRKGMAHYRGRLAALDAGRWPSPQPPPSRHDDPADVHPTQVVGAP